MSIALHCLALTAFISVAGLGAAEVRAAGLNTLYRSAIDGIPNTAMFAKGGHQQLSDDEIRSLVDYMLHASGIEQPLLLAAQRYDALGLTQREFIALDQDRNAELLRQIQQRLNSVAGMPSAGIKLSAKDGAVVVAGRVRDAQLARQAYNAIRWTPGLRSLDNRLMPAEILLFD